MTNERFNELLNGPLTAPMQVHTITRLKVALRIVVERCGEIAERALEEHCSHLSAQDERTDWGG